MEFRRVLAFLAGTVLCASLTPGVVAAPRADDITGTDYGAAAASAAATRFRGYGWDTTPNDLRVVRVASGDIIGPAFYTTAELASLEAGGSVSLRDAPPTATSDTDQNAIAAAPYWGLVGSYCFSRTYYYGGEPVQQRLGFMDVCYHKHQVKNDGDPTWDFYNIHSFGTVDATNSAAYTDDAFIRVQKSSGPTFYWFDWSPRGDLSGNCGVQTLGVSYAGVGLTYGHSVCEWWLLTKYAEAGKLKVTWDGFTKGAREVALMAAVKVVNGGVPQWSFSWGATMRCVSVPCPYQ